MTECELVSRYFDWMYRLVADDRYPKSYRKLFSRLHDTEFTYTIPMDGNRAEDGIDLRYRFGRENAYPDAIVASLLDVVPCSILEMEKTITGYSSSLPMESTSSGPAPIYIPTFPLWWTIRL